MCVSWSKNSVAHISLLVRWRIILSPLLSKPFPISQMKATYNTHSPLPSGTNVFKSPLFAEQLPPNSPCWQCQGSKTQFSFTMISLMMKIELLIARTGCDGRCNYPWTSSLAYGYFHHLVIAMLNIRTMTYQLHSSSQQDNCDHFTHLFDISYGACIQRKGENYGDFCYLLSTVLIRVKPRFPPQSVVGDLIHNFDMIGYTLSVPLLLRIEVPLVSFYIWG